MSMLVESCWVDKTLSNGIAGLTMASKQSLDACIVHCEGTKECTVPSANVKQLGSVEQRIPISRDRETLIVSPWYCWDFL